MRVPLVLALVFVVGCGSTASKQAEDLHSLAAEGALLAHDAREGDEWKPYRQAHSKELAKKTSSLEAAAKSRALSELATSIAGDLDRLSQADRRQAAVLERRLDDAATRAEQLE